jgi:hypothetical protein
VRDSCSKAVSDIPELQQDKMKAVRIKVQTDCEHASQRLNDIAHQLEDAIEDWQRFIDANCEGGDCARIADGIEKRRLQLDVVCDSLGENSVEVNSASASLRRALLARSDVFVTVMAEKLLTYATGRAMRPEDMPAVRGVVRGMAPGGHRFSSMVLEVVRTPQFQMRMKAGT